MPDRTLVDPPVLDPDERWSLIASAAEDNGFIRAIVQLATDVHADVSVTLRAPEDDRYLTVSFGHATEEDDADGA